MMHTTLANAYQECKRGRKSTVDQPVTVLLNTQIIQDVLLDFTPTLGQRVWLQLARSDRSARLLLRPPEKPELCVQVQGFARSTGQVMVTVIKENR